MSTFSNNADINNRGKPVPNRSRSRQQRRSKRLTQADQFTVAGGSENHDKITKHGENLRRLDKKGKTLNNVEREELTDIISKNIPQFKVNFSSLSRLKHMSDAPQKTFINPTTKPKFKSPNPPFSEPQDF